MAKKKKRYYDPWDELFRKFFEEIEELEEMMEEEMKRFRGTDFLREWEELVRRMPKEGKEPLVYGFSIKIGPEGPIIEEFGNVKRGEILKEREPLVDVINREKEITVLAEMPGVKKEDIDVEAKQRTLTIRVPGKFFKKIELPEPIDPNNIRARYKNGVLEVVMKKSLRKKVRVE